MNQSTEPSETVPGPTVARVWSALLGGKDHMAADRRLVAKARKANSDIEQLADAMQGFRQRAVASLARDIRIDQFVDCGPGYPRPAENTHDIAQKINLEARVLYVDQDPNVLAHGRALLAVNDRVGVLEADPNDVVAIREHAGSRRLIDWDRPVAIVNTMPLAFADPDLVDSAKTVQAWIGALAAGSHLTLGFLAVTDGLENVTASIGKMFCSELRGGRFLPLPDIEAVFDGLELVDPDLTICDGWRPHIDEPYVAPGSIRRCAVGGVARVPTPSRDPDSVTPQ